MADMGDLRSKLTLYTSEMLLYLNFDSMSIVGRIEQRMGRDGGVLRDIKIAIKKKTAHIVLYGGNWEGTILTTYTDDNTSFWKGLRRDLVREGLPCIQAQASRQEVPQRARPAGVYSVITRLKTSTNGNNLWRVKPSERA